MRKFINFGFGVLFVIAFNSCGLFGGSGDLTSDVYTAIEAHVQSDGTDGGILARDIYEEEILKAQNGEEQGKYSILRDQDSDSLAIEQAIAGAGIAKERVLAEGLVSGQKTYIVDEVQNLDSADFKIVVSISSVFGYVIPVSHGFRYRRMEAVTYAEPEAVDLGLSVLWASWNVGATAPEEFGGFYAWGETEQKESYTWENYKWGDGSNFTKYFNNGAKILEAEDDAATANLGNGWRTPTYSEMEALINNCTWTEDNVNDVRGYRVEGTNGNSIFIPMAGSKGELGTNTNFGWYGNYHIAERYTGKVGYTYYLRFHGSGQYIFEDAAYSAITVRAVKEK